ncbi:MAG: tetratricopeptide repeat protein [Pseudomonadota bacterium]
MVPLSFAHVFRPLLFGSALFLAACDSAEDRIAEHYDRANGFMAEGDADKAMVEFRNVLQVKEDHVDARYQLSVLLKEAGRVRPALRNLLRVVEIQPDHLEGRKELADILLRSGQVDEALKHSEAAYKIDPNSVDVLSQRASIALFLGNFDLAEKLALRAEEIDPFDPAPGLVLSAHRLRTDDIDGALQIADRYIGFDESVVDLHLAKLQILRAKGEPGPMGDQLKRMVALFPDVAGFRRALIQWRAETGDEAGVEADLRALVELEPGDCSKTRFCTGTSKARIIIEVWSLKAREGVRSPTKTFSISSTASKAKVSQRSWMRFSTLMRDRRRERACTKAAPCWTERSPGSQLSVSAW